ncbi:TRAP transporter - DctQ subunit [Dinoroseobacter shibae DFL 12 = DSM 16493]|jgi:TRAP-type mannitol/chloroaromatic compound transport system permease small subunit|uniref:TRAP transporter small permease protein n=2 Tax=Pseudomonadota TaxID=1224 RepID=A8LNN5_DINSH|nr:TRAP transporter small permease subunit [Dinoroseobacter shibae]ABV95129.1 TRAP transporter - DctQ subunit [Dinoroseobacter shibae DFL 12 = DSM 16493]URF46543.1 TRAP transporter small permease subunit [Dinoroseobacter shibae]URF50849.1 TRAP transporter small permease subunit [Dinoroseobacter shibae]
MEPVEEIIKLSDPGEVGREEHNRGDRVIVQISNVMAWLFPILMVAIVAQVFLRGSGMNQAWLDDLQWWLYGSAVLVGIGYAVTNNAHVRVDILFDNFGSDKKNRIEIFGLVWLFLPFIILCWDVTLPYAIASVSANEGSDSPNGLHNLWMLKVFMNVSFAFIGIAIWSAYVRFLNKMTEPVLWKQLLFAFPSTMFLINLVVYYSIWWALRLTTPADVTNREIGRHPIFDELQVGVEEIPYTIIITVIVTFIVIGLAYARDRAREARY